MVDRTLMYTKYKYNKLIAEYLEPVKKALNIHSKVNIHVYNSQSKKYKKLMPHSSKVRGSHEYGFSLINMKHDADIFLFYDKHSSDRNAFGTLIHELLHVRIAKITGLVTIRAETAARAEEFLVRDLEKMLINLFWDGKL